MRVPLAIGLESRNGERTPRDETQGYPRDARIINGIVEVKGETTAVVRKRPGLVNVGLVKAGVGQLIHNWNGIRAIVDDYINSGTISTIVNTPPSTNLTPTNADLQFSAANTGSGAATPRMMFKNRSQAWTMNRAGTVSAVTYGGTMGSETYAVVSLTRVSTTATAVVASDVPFEIGDSVTIAGATPTDYNGAQTVTGVTPGVYTPERLIPITITRSGTTATATTVSGAHGLTSGTAYTIAGASEAAYNGSKTITATGTDTFTYTVSVTSAPTTTWNPSDKNASITLSGGDLVATAGVTGGFLGVRGTVGKASGKRYWEVTATTVGGSGQMEIGIAKVGASLSGSSSVVADTWAYASSGMVSENQDFEFGYATYVTGDVIGVALDMDTGRVTFYKNGALVKATETAFSGTLYPYVALYDSNVSTVNFGGSAFAQTAPSGFAALASDSPASPAAGSITVADPAVATPATFTFAIGGSVTTPATGTITAQGIGGTVPGIGYLNGYFAVMDTSGTIWNSASDDPTSWNALAFLTAQNDSSRGAGIAVSRGYLVAFKEWSTEFFYDAANASGSPFSPVDSAPLQIGCATGWSIASIDDFTFWMSQTKAKGRGVHMLVGIEQKKVSTPDVDRILDDASIDTVYAFCLKIDGHLLYVLTLAADAEGITLVYDSTSDVWGEWTTYESVGTSNTISSITRSGNVATASFSAVIDGLPDGASVVITGATQSEYNGVKQIYDYTIVDEPGNPPFTRVSFGVLGDPLTPATTASSLVMYRGTPTQLDFVGAISFGGSVLLLSADGYIYAVEDEIYVDETRGTPSTKSRIGIDFVMRTPRLDGASLASKKNAAISVVGTNVDDTAMVRWSDDDGQTWGAFRPVDLSIEEPRIRRCGAFRRRSFEVNHAGNTSPIFEALELDISR